MNLPIYQIIYLKTGQIEELNEFLFDEINLTRAICFDIVHLTEEQQRETIGLIENFFSTRNLSFYYPYPIYITSLFNQSFTHIPLVKSKNDLPRFFNQKDERLSAKETSILGRNKLFQQEIKNQDPAKLQSIISQFAGNHKKLFMIHHEKSFYQQVLKKITS